MSWSLLYLISEWTIRAVMLIYVPQRRTSAAARTWLLLIFLLPWPGLLLYALFGRIWLPRRRFEMQERASRVIRQVQAQMVTSEGVLAELPRDAQPIASLATGLGDFVPLGGNTIELLAEYDRAIDRLIEDIDRASHHVHLLFYIYGADHIGGRVAEALERAVKRGVTCRVMMDDVGSKNALRHLAPQMRQNGIEVIAMLPVGLFRTNAARFDLRNHRKIAVIDGCIGYTGSQNIVDPWFVPDHPNEELLVRLTGPVVAQLQAVFLADHFFETGTPLEREGMVAGRPGGAGRSRAQIVPSGPGYRRENAKELIVAMIYAARKRVVITTPYFVPDDPVLQAIRSATREGVEVHLVVSMHANRLVTQLAQRSYYDDLVESGVIIHLYRPHFLHAKHVTIDDFMAIVATTNMDIRSFALNAEVNLLIYDAEVIRELEILQQRYFADSEVLLAEAWESRPLPSRILQNTARLADSLL